MTSVSHPVFTAIVFVSVLVARGESGVLQRARIVIVIEARGLSSSSYPRPPVSSLFSTLFLARDTSGRPGRVSVHRVACHVAARRVTMWSRVPELFAFAGCIRTHARAHARVSRDDPLCRESRKVRPEDQIRRCVERTREESLGTRSNAEIFRESPRFIWLTIRERGKSCDLSPDRSGHPLRYSLEMANRERAQS